MQKEVYLQSTWIAVQVANLYYMEGLSGKDIADRLDISPSTVSRLLTKSKSDNIISFQLNEPFSDCLKAADELKEVYKLKDVIVIPSSGESLDVDRKAVALEGARYLQRIITDTDVLGVAWGRTMSYLIKVLNPCLKSDNAIVTLHGNISSIQKDFNPETLVKRIAMACGGKQYCFTDPALRANKEELRELMKKEQNRIVENKLSEITISVTGCGSLYPYADSPILNAEYDYLTTEDVRDIKEKNARGDMLLRFFDDDGKECDTSLKDRTLSISFREYEKIPTRIIVSADEAKAYTMRSLLRGKLANVLIIDYSLARKLLMVTRAMD